MTMKASATCDVTPTVSVSCSPTDLALGPTAPSSTTIANCNTTASPAGGTYSWSVNTTNVTLSASGGGATVTAANQSTSQGDTVVTVTYTVNAQNATAKSAGITVHKPTSLMVLSDTTDPSGFQCTVPCLANPGDGTCNASTANCSYSSYLRQRQYSVLDQLDPPKEFANVGISQADVTETVPISSTCPGVTTITGSSIKTIFPDSFFLCSTCCLTSGPGCTAQTNPVQTISVNGIPVRSETISFTCTGVTLTP